MLIDVSLDDIKDKVINGKPVVFKDYKIPRENENFYVETLGLFLKDMGKERIFDHLGYCLREIINNAKKANIKRVFFLDENLDISNPEDYEKGMKYFKEKSFSNLDYYLDLQEKYKLFVQIYFHIKDPNLNIIISNNSPILKQEQAKIINRISKAKSFDSVEEAYQSVLDDSEGAGLGIVILILILRKIGINERNFAIAVENNTTHVRVAVPLSLVTEEDAEIVSSSVIKEIESIPQIPEHITKLTEMLRDEEVDFKAISQLIKTDPSLTMDILKMANSVYYKTLNKIEKVELAISIMGVKGLEYMLHSYGAKHALKAKYSEAEFNSLWKQSTEIARISSAICEINNMQDFAEDAYIGGLLHNIGKIVIRGLHPDTIEKITELCMEKDISINILGDLLEGTNYVKIGAKMAEKWNLPEKITNIIKYHLSPYRSPEDVREICKTIYLALMISSKLHKEDVQYIFSSNIMEGLYLDTEVNLDDITARVIEKLKEKR